MICLLTDFGTQDPWVGEMKGRLASLAPGIPLQDLAHDLAPGDVAAGAFHLAGAVEAWPPGTIFLTVIDPGVGSPRRALTARIGGTGAARLFVGPDNGLLSDLDLSRVEAFEIRPDPDAPRRGTTFDGRDLFAPAAAHLANGARPEDLGPRVAAPIRLPEIPDASVWYVDRFGNVITRAAPREGIRAVEILGREFPLRGPVASYAQAREGEAVVLVSSRGTLEIALGGASFAARAGLAAGGGSRGVPVRFRI